MYIEGCKELVLNVILQAASDYLNPKSGFQKSAEQFFKSERFYELSADAGISTERIRGCIETLLSKGLPARRVKRQNNINVKELRG
jgi:hypothetical protein